MELEKQVCSLEPARELKELGVKQESVWWWKVDDNDLNAMLGFDGKLNKIDYYGNKRKYSYSAFTVAELGEIILKALKYTPSSRLCECLPNFENEDQGNLGWFFTHCFSGEDWEIHDLDATTEADARAMMIIWLIENKLI